MTPRPRTAFQTSRYVSRGIAVAAVLLSIVAGPLAGAPAVAQVPPGELTLDDFVGRYALTPRFHLTVTREGRALFLHVTGQERMPLTPRGGLEFVIVGTNLRVVFGIQQETGEVFDLLFEQGGLGRRAVKLEPGGGPADPVAVELPQSALEPLVGTYEEQPGFAIAVTLEEGQLVAALTDLPGAAILPSAADEFFYPDGRGRISFRRDAEGTVVSLVLHQGGADVEMRRID